MNSRDSKFVLSAKEIKKMNDFLTSIPAKIIARRKKLGFLEDLHAEADAKAMLKTAVPSQTNILDSSTIHSRNVFKNEINDRPKSANINDRRSMNSIEVELREMEYLNLLRDKQPHVFRQFTKQKVTPKRFKQWHSRSNERVAMTDARKEVMKELYDPALSSTFTPYISEKSRQLATQPQTYASTKHFKSPNRTQRLQQQEEEKLKKPKRKFNDEEFANHMNKVNAWNQGVFKNNIKKFIADFMTTSDVRSLTPQKKPQVSLATKNIMGLSRSPNKSPQMNPIHRDYFQNHKEGDELGVRGNKLYSFGTQKSVSTHGKKNDGF